MTTYVITGHTGQSYEPDAFVLEGYHPTVVDGIITSEWVNDEKKTKLDILPYPPTGGYAVVFRSESDKDSKSESDKDSKIPSRIWFADKISIAPREGTSSNGQTLFVEDVTPEYNATYFIVPSINAITFVQKLPVGKPWVLQEVSTKKGRNTDHTPSSEESVNPSQS